MNFFGAAFSERNGKPSSHRMLVGFGCVTVLGVWSLVSVEKKELQPLSTEQAAIVLGGLGVGAWKRGREGDGAKEPAKAL